MDIEREFMSRSSVTLTTYERAALAGYINLSDGHAHQSATERQQRVVQDLPRLFREARLIGPLEAENRFKNTYFKTAIRETDAVSLGVRTLPCYSASMAMELVANFLRLRRLNAVLIEPTFDNIPNILRRHQVGVASVSDRVAADDPAAMFNGDPGAVMIVSPNNPTGTTYSREWWTYVAKKAAETGAIVVADFAFRLFDPLSLWNQYAVLDAAGAAYLGIEDMGKTWPTEDIKLGLLIASSGLYAEVDAIHDDMLLNLSPAVYLFLEEMINCSVAEGFEAHVHSLCRANRAIAADILGPEGFLERTVLASMGVAWMELPEHVPDAREFCERLVDNGVHVLPGSPFFWANADKGRRYIRLAMMRDSALVAEGCRRMVLATRHR